MRNNAEHPAVIAIELPYRLDRWHDKLMGRVQGAYAELRVPNRIPHISLVYLDPVRRSHVEDIVSIVRKYIDLIAGNEVSVTEGGQFCLNRNDVRIRNLHLKAKATGLDELRRKLVYGLHGEKLLSKDNDRNEDFKPHVGTGFVVERRHSRPDKRLSSIFDILNKEKWTFRANGLVLYRGNEVTYISPPVDSIPKFLARDSERKSSAELVSGIV